MLGAGRGKLRTNAKHGPTKKIFVHIAVLIPIRYSFTFFRGIRLTAGNVCTVPPATPPLRALASGCWRPAGATQAGGKATRHCLLIAEKTYYEASGSSRRSLRQRRRPNDAARAATAPAAGGSPALYTAGAANKDIPPQSDTW